MTKELKNLPFRRVYFDVPHEVYAAMEDRAKAVKMSRKDYLAKLVTDDVTGKRKR